MAMFNSYVSLPEGISPFLSPFQSSYLGEISFKAIRGHLYQWYHPYLMSSNLYHHFNNLYHPIYCVLCLAALSLWASCRHRTCDSDWLAQPSFRLSVLTRTYGWFGVIPNFPMTQWDRIQPLVSGNLICYTNLHIQMDLGCSPLVCTHINIESE